MLDDYKVVCVTPAGRRQSMRLLVPYILSSTVVDRYDIWVNTKVPQDLKFLRALEVFPRVRLVEQPDGIINGNASIGSFFRHAIAERTIYIRFDDDIVWMSKHAIERLAKFRAQNKQYFLISAMIINNAICTNLLQNLKMITLEPRVAAYVLDEVGWKSGEFAERLHREMIFNIRSNKIEEMTFGPRPIANARFSINCISWLGDTFSEFGGMVSENDEEEFLSVILPQMRAESNCICGDAFVSHYSFFTQKAYLDKTNVIAEYRELQSDCDWADMAVISQVEDIYSRTET